MGRRRGGGVGHAWSRLSAGLTAFCALTLTAVILGSGLTVPALARWGTPSEKPRQVRWASLSQQGRQLEWQVQFNAPVSLVALKRQRRTLCLLIEWPQHGALRGELCAKPGRGQDFRELVYREIRRGRARPGQAIRGTISKPNARELQIRFLPAAVGLHYWRLRWQVINTVPGPGCTRLPGAPRGCISLYPERGQLLRLHIPRLAGCVPGGPSPVFGGPSNRHDIALTFDDGPWWDPPSIDFVRLLHRYHVPATFFEIGDQISQYDPTGSVERQMLADGDIIGDHTWTHPNMTQLSSSAQRSELLQTVQAIQQETGFRTCIWRPPYEAYDPQVVGLARSLGLLTINYDVDTRDWSLPGSATIYQRAVSGAHTGAIILQHFGGGPRSQTLAALPQEITTLRREGYRFVTIPEMLGLRLIYK